MKKAVFMMAIALAGIAFYSFTQNPGKNHFYKTTEDSLAIERGKFITYLLDSLKDKKHVAGDSVFKNLQVFNDKERVPVTHFLAIMDYWGEALNVNCTYCHSPADWSSDSLRTKRIARDMYYMRQKINGQILSNIRDLSSKRPEVNCGTCHHGKAIPSE
jgi:hypothetical protein